MPNNDYILRSDAVSAFCGNCEGTEVCGQLGEPCEEIKRVKAIPAADVEPKREIVPWKVAGAFDDFYQCTKCGNMWPIFSTVEWAYCPACGCRKFSEPQKEEDNAEVH